MTASADLSAPDPAAASPRPLSDVLDDLRQSLPRRDAVTVGTLVDALYERGVGALMVLFALLVMIPIPGLNTLFAAPLVLLTARQALGNHTVWLPQKMVAKHLEAERMAAQIKAFLPWLRALEKI